MSKYEYYYEYNGASNPWTYIRVNRETETYDSLFLHPVSKVTKLKLNQPIDELNFRHLNTDEKVEKYWKEDLESVLKYLQSE